MLFEVTYRSVDGAQKVEEVNADSRAECLAQMRKRGIMAISVKEGARIAPSRTGGADASRNTYVSWRSITVCCALALIVGCLWWWLTSGRCTAPEAKPDAPRRKALPKAIIPAPAATNATPRKEASRPEPKPLRAVAAPPPGKVISVRTNDNDLVITAVVGADGKTNLITKALHEPVFSNPADQLIAAAMNAAMTGQMAPLPLGPESDLQFKAALKTPILDSPDDSDEVKRMKQVVRETREQIAELMERGQSFAEILAQHRDLWNENIKIREGVVAEYRRIVRSGDEDEAARYLSAMNAALGQMGIPPLTESDGHSKRRKAKTAKEGQ